MHDMVESTNVDSKKEMHLNFKTYIRLIIWSNQAPVPARFALQIRLRPDFPKANPVRPNNLCQAPISWCSFISGEMVTKGLPNQQSTVEGIGDGSHSQIYIPDYTVEAVTDLIIVRISTDQYAGALHAASLDRHLRAVGQESDAGEFPASSDAPSPLVEYTSRDHLLDSDADAAAVNNLVNMETKSCDV